MNRQYWNLVLIEIEEPKKKTFLKDSEYIKFTAEFNNAYDQVLSWKAYLEEDNNTAELRKRVRKLMGDSPIANIPFYVKQGFDKYEKTIKNFFIDNYDEEIKTLSDLGFWIKLKE